MANKLTYYLYKLLHDQMKMIDIVDSKPKTKVRLDPIDPEDLNVDLEVVQKWSRNNFQLLQLIMENGMATFICNKQYIFEHYEQLVFVNRRMDAIDMHAKKFINMISLNLSENYIFLLNVEYLPPNLQQLYIDFNKIDKIQCYRGKDFQNTNLALLSISHNRLADSQIKSIVGHFPNLRCLNVTGNKLCDIRNLVQQVKKLDKLKIFSAKNNPISMLKVYDEYITGNLELKVFDNEKYVKPEPPKKVIEQPKPPVKEQPKEQKKDPKKDPKKGAKQPEPVVQQKPKEQPVIEKKKQLTDEDFTKCSINLSITNFQNFTGNLYDPAIFGQELTPEKIQTTYWLSYLMMDNLEDFSTKRVRFDEATIVQNEPSRLNFSINTTKQFQVNLQNQKLFQKGLLIEVFSQQPVVQTTQTGQQKPVKENNQLTFKRQKLGQVYVDLKQVLGKKQKKMEKLYKLWQSSLCSRPYFQHSMPNETEQINKRKQKFQEQLKKEEEQKFKKLQQQEAAKNQKKGGKDAKKAQKKPQKKQGKEVLGEKKVLEKSNYPEDQKTYCYLNEDKLYKCKKETLAVKVQIA